VEQKLPELSEDISEISNHWSRDLFKEKIDAILKLKNGTGILQILALVPEYLQHLESVLAPNGQVLLDSCDLKYMHDASTNGD
jgi:hypothetical protein